MRCRDHDGPWSGRGNTCSPSVEENEDQTGNASKDVIAELGRVSDSDSRAVEMRGTALRVMRASPVLE